MTAYPHLFAPWSLAGRTLRNRVMYSAISSIYPAGGRVTDRLLDLYGNRAAGGVAAIVTEALKCHRAQAAPTRVDAADEAGLDGLKRWADRVEQHGARLLGQLYDPGRGRHHPGRSQYAIGASVLPDDLSWTVPRALSVSAIAALVAEMAETARRLQRAGFSGVELSWRPMGICSTIPLPPGEPSGGFVRRQHGKPHPAGAGAGGGDPRGLRRWVHPGAEAGGR